MTAAFVETSGLGERIADGLRRGFAVHVVPAFSSEAQPIEGWWEVTVDRRGLHLAPSERPVV